MKRVITERGGVNNSLTRDEWLRLAVIAILFFFSVMFWAAIEQSGSSMTLFASENTRASFLGLKIQASYFQSINPLFIIALAPVFSWLWAYMGNRQPSSPAKFAFGLLFAGLGFLLLACGSTFTGAGRVSPMWLVMAYLLHTVGELCLSPVGLSTVTKLSPARIVGLMMGLWFLSLSFGNYLASYVAGFFKADSEGALVTLFGSIGAAAIAGAGVLWLLTPLVRRLVTLREQPQRS